MFCQHVCWWAIPWLYKYNIRQKSTTQICETVNKSDNWGISIMNKLGSFLIDKTIILQEGAYDHTYWGWGWG